MRTIFTTRNMNSTDEFMTRNVHRLYKACLILMHIREFKLKEPETYDKKEQKIFDDLKSYDKSLLLDLSELIDRTYTAITSTKLTEIACANENRHGTEKQMVLAYIEELGRIFEIELFEEE